MIASAIFIIFHFCNLLITRIIKFRLIGLYQIGALYIGLCNIVDILEQFISFGLLRHTVIPKATSSPSAKIKKNFRHIISDWITVHILSTNLSGKAIVLNLYTYSYHFYLQSMSPTMQHNTRSLRR